MRIVDQMLPGVFDRRLISAFAPEVVRQIERPDDLIEKRLEHENGEAEKFYATLPSAAQVGMEATINLRDSEVHSDWCMSHRISTDALRKDSSVRTT